MSGLDDFDFDKALERVSLKRSIVISADELTWENIKVLGNIVIELANLPPSAIPSIERRGPKWHLIFRNIHGDLLTGGEDIMSKEDVYRG